MNAEVRPRILDLAAGWKMFESRVVPAGAGPRQRLEMRRCFYAGSAWLLGAQLKLTNSPITSEAGAEELNALHREIENFAVDITKGRA